MRTTLNIDNDLFLQPKELTGLKEKTCIIIVIISAVVLLHGFTTLAFAAEPSGIHLLLSDRFLIRAGIMDAYIDGSVSLGENGTNIDL